MTKQNFIALADHLRGLDIPEDVLAALVDFCRSQNPAFNRDRWLNYLNGKCGPNGGKLKKTREAERFAKFVGNLLAS